ncbi:MAG TPA: CoA pyrophosphatase [Gemmatimonadales bacterium]|nr:CoA pyrophosphatase [Gemmatimonadales bacterium]
MPGQAQAAVAIVLLPQGSHGPEMLFIKRAEFAGDPWSGHLALPGGRRHPEDETLLATAIRETAEEVGVRLTGSSVLGELDDLSPVSPHLPQVIVRPFVFGLPVRPEIITSDEVALHLWVSRDALLAARTSELLPLFGGSRSMPGYRLGTHFIWGMTERIITPFLGLLHPGPVQPT